MVSAGTLSAAGLAGAAIAVSAGAGAAGAAEGCESRLTVGEAGPEGRAGFFTKSAGAMAMTIITMMAQTTRRSTIS
jgi:hypothetical protein